jgi:hypothetical protein
MIDPRPARLLLRRARSAALSLSQPEGKARETVAVATTLEGHPVLRRPASASEVAPRAERLRAILSVPQSDERGAPGPLRLSLVGHLLAPSGREVEAIARRYAAIHPGAPAADKEITILEPGRVTWGLSEDARRSVSGEDWLLATPEWREREADVLEHMNADHIDSMVRMLRHFYGVRAEKPRLAAVDPDGLHLVEGERGWFLPFDRACASYDDVHHATVRLARAARGAPG